MLNILVGSSTILGSVMDRLRPLSTFHYRNLPWENRKSLASRRNRIVYSPNRIWDGWKLAKGTWRFPAWEYWHWFQRSNGIWTETRAAKALWWWFRSGRSSLNRPTYRKPKFAVNRGLWIGAPGEILKRLSPNVYITAKFNSKIYQRISETHFFVKMTPIQWLPIDALGLLYWMLTTKGYCLSKDGEIPAALCPSTPIITRAESFNSSKKSEMELIIRVRSWNRRNQGNTRRKRQTHVLKPMKLFTGYLQVPIAQCHPSGSYLKQSENEGFEHQLF